MTYSVPVGQMRHRVQLQSSTLAADAYGEQVRTFTTYATVWARVETSGGSESPVAGQNVALTNRKVTVRYNEAILPDQQLLWRGRTLQIRSVSDPDGNLRFMILDCEDRQVGQTTETP